VPAFNVDRAGSEEQFERLLDCTRAVGTISRNLDDLMIGA
jgi:hypothetical protein